MAFAKFAWLIRYTFSSQSPPKRTWQATNPLQYRVPLSKSIPCAAGLQGAAMFPSLPVIPPVDTGGSPVLVQSLAH
jgi:hypothetical protein